MEKVLYLSQEDVLACGVLNMAEAIGTVEKALILLEEGNCVQPAKSVLRWGDNPETEQTRGRINFLSAYVGGDIGALGMKWVSSFPKNKEGGVFPRAAALIIMNDPMTGIPIAFMDGTIISAVRTGAISGIGAKYLARADSETVGIIGTGVQSRTQLLALKTVLNGLKEVKAYDLVRKRAEGFSSEMEERLGIPVKVSSTAEGAIRNTDIALVATTSNRPLMKVTWISPGALSIQFSGHECEYGVIKHADKLVCDDWEAIKHRGISTPALMHQQGLLRDNQIHASLGEILAAKQTGRTFKHEHIHFFSVGMGVTDVAVASSVLNRAVRLGLGRELPLWNRPLWT